MFDVVIIGAGPSGTAAAYDLLDKGLTVLILDKYKFPRKKACAGGITPKCFNLFQYDISSVVQRICYKVKITTGSQRSFLIQDKTQLPLCYMTNRTDLDIFSLNKVIGKGAIFKVAKKIIEIVENKRCVKIITGSQTFKCKYLIGADGANSIVRRHLFHSFAYKKQFAIEADVKIEASDQYQMEFDFSQKTNGYYWIFPKRGFLNIGIYNIDSKKVSSTSLYEYAQARLGNIKLENVKGYPICTHGFKYTSNSSRAFLVGDAAGMAEHLLGEGVYFAVKTGQLAANAIIESNRKGLPPTYLYSKSLKRVQLDLKIHKAASRFFYNFSDLSLKILSLPFIHKPFVMGYAKGRPLIDILTNLDTIFRSKNQISKL